MDFAVILDRSSPTPLQRQLYDQWRTAILRGRFRPGLRMPSTRALAASLLLSRATVTAAYDQLLAEGYLETIRGSGTYVCRHLPEELLHAARQSRQQRREGPELALSQYAERLLARGKESPPRQPNAIDLDDWGPDRHHFPLREWRNLYSRMLRAATPDLFGYSHHPGGLPKLREAIAAYLARSRAVECEPSDVLIVNGSQQALDLVTRVLIDPGGVVAVEDPAYQGARDTFLAHGAKLLPIPVDAEGLVTNRLPPRGVSLVYVTPSHQFPSGSSLSLPRRFELLEWARRARAVILEDDYDSEYRYHGRPLPALQSMAGSAAVVYTGSFSKVLFPGLRIGYVVAPKRMRIAMERAKYLSGRQGTILDQMVLAEFIAQGRLERHIRRMRTLYAGRREVLLAALQRHFAGRHTVHGDAAGMHVMVSFHCGLSCAELVSRAAAAGVIAGSGNRYYEGGAPDARLVFGYAAAPEALIRLGVRKLATAFA